MTKLLYKIIKDEEVIEILISTAVHWHFYYVDSKEKRKIIHN